MCTSLSFTNHAAVISHIVPCSSSSKRREAEFQRSTPHSYNKMSFIHRVLSLKLFFADNNLCPKSKLGPHPAQMTYDPEIRYLLQYFFCDLEQN